MRGRNRIVIDLVRNFLELVGKKRRTALANLVPTLRSREESEAVPAAA
jgi:hypothetical protein